MSLLLFYQNTKKQKVYSQKYKWMLDQPFPLLLFLPTLFTNVLVPITTFTCPNKVRHTTTIERKTMPKMLHYGVENAFVSSNERKIRGERSGENMKQAVSRVIKAVMHVQWRWWRFSYAHYLTLFVGRVLWDRGKDVLLFVLSLYMCK